MRLRWGKVAAEIDGSWAPSYHMMHMGLGRLAVEAG